MPRWDLVYKWADPETRSLVDAVTSALENCDRKLTEALAATPPSGSGEASEGLTQEEEPMSGHAAQGVLSDADVVLAAALSVAVPSMLMEDAMEKAPGMIDHLRAQGFDVLRLATPDPSAPAEEPR